jgi:Putative Ig domain
MTFRVVFGILLLIAVVQAIPWLTFPINSQVPPVARVSVPFKYTFSNSTFSSSWPLTYNLSKGPSWLFLDGATRTLSGTAPSAEAPLIEITASDETGSTSMETVLVVSDNPAPVVRIPIEDQLASFGTYSPPDTILYYTSTPFNFSFNPDTFAGYNLTYYATSSDNAPLPSWIQFDADTLLFSGETPDARSITQPPQVFGFQLIASDVVGFAGVSIPFHMVVERHILEFANGFLYTNVTVGSPVDFTGLVDSLRLDGKTVDNSDVATVDAQTPNWLSFDNSTFRLSGTVPSNATSWNSSVTVVDAYGDTAKALVQFYVVRSVFATIIRPLNATIGMPFFYNLSSTVLDPPDVNLSVQLFPATPWLSFNDRSSILSGDVPLEAQPSTINVLVQATSRSSHVSDSRTLVLNIVPAPKSSTTPTTTGSTTSTASSLTLLPGELGNKLSSGIIAAIVVPIVLVFTAVLLCLFYYMRKEHLAKPRLNLSKGDISVPMRNSGQTQVSFSAAGTDHLKNSRGRGSNVRISGDSRLRLESRLGSNPATLISLQIGSPRISSQGSGHPPLSIVPERSPITKVTRNFSRKGGDVVVSGECHSEFTSRGTSLSSNRVSSSSIRSIPNFACGATGSKRRAPNHLGDIPETSRRKSGLGYGARKSVSEFSDLSDDVTYGRSKELKNHRVSSRGSIDAVTPYRKSMSDITDLTTLISPIPGRMTEGVVLDSSNRTPNARLSESSESLQKRIRKSVGASPFFGGSSRSRRYKKSKLLLISGIDTNSDLEDDDLRGLRGLETKDAFGVSYMSARGDAQQFSKLVNRLSGHKDTATQFSDNDSRLRSAEQSPQTEQFSFFSQDELESGHLNHECPALDRGSYESSIAGSNRNSIHYDSDELHEMAQSPARSTVEEGILTPFASFSNPSSPNPDNGEVHERYMQGARRPVSVDTGLHKKRSFTASQHYEEEHGNDIDTSNSNPSGPSI